jgi:hypothetical protein
MKFFVTRSVHLTCTSKKKEAMTGTPRDTLMNGALLSLLSLPHTITRSPLSHLEAAFPFSRLSLPHLLRDFQIVLDFLAPPQHEKRPFLPLKNQEPSETLSSNPWTDLPSFLARLEALEHG